MRAGGSRIARCAQTALSGRAQTGVMRMRSRSRSRLGRFVAPAALGAAVMMLFGLAACAPEREPDPRPEPLPAPTGEAPEPSTERMLLLASLAHGDEVAIIDPALPDAEAVVRRITVGAAPWGVGVHGGTGYAATAEGLAVIDLAAGERTALVQYRHPAVRIGSGEYRPGGLALAIAPDGSRVYVAVTADGSAEWLEVFDTASGAFVAAVQVGLRPFDVLADPGGRWVATVDHDGFTVTVIDAVSLVPAQYTVAPFGTAGGLASWEKPHYGAIDANGTIHLPYQGLAVARLDPLTGRYDTVSSRANSHAHGVALAGRLLVTVGTGSFGNATGGPNLSLLDLDSGEERIVPLDPPHETVAIWRDEAGREYAAASGGNTREMGWDGITLVALDDLELRRIPVAGYPQNLVSFAGR